MSDDETYSIDEDDYRDDLNDGSMNIYSQIADATQWDSKLMTEYENIKDKDNKLLMNLLNKEETSEYGDKDLLEVYEINKTGEDVLHKNITDGVFNSIKLTKKEKADFMKYFTNKHTTENVDITVKNTKIQKLVNVKLFQLYFNIFKFKEFKKGNQDFINSTYKRQMIFFLHYINNICNINNFTSKKLDTKKGWVKLALERGNIVYRRYGDQNRIVIPTKDELINFQKLVGDSDAIPLMKLSPNEDNNFLMGQAIDKSTTSFIKEKIMELLPNDYMTLNNFDIIDFINNEIITNPNNMMENIVEDLVNEKNLESNFSKFLNNLYKESVIEFLILQLPNSEEYDKIVNDIEEKLSNDKTITFLSVLQEHFNNFNLNQQFINSIKIDRTNERHENMIVTLINRLHTKSKSYNRKVKKLLEEFSNLDYRHKTSKNMINLLETKLGITINKQIEIFTEKYIKKIRNKQKQDICYVPTEKDIQEITLMKTPKLEDIKKLYKDFYNLTLDETNMQNFTKLLNKLELIETKVNTKKNKEFIKVIRNDKIKQIITKIDLHIINIPFDYYVEYNESGFVWTILNQLNIKNDDKLESDIKNFYEKRVEYINESMLTYVSKEISTLIVSLTDSDTGEIFKISDFGKDGLGSIIEYKKPNVDLIIDNVLNKDIKTNERFLETWFPKIYLASGEKGLLVHKVVEEFKNEKRQGKFYAKLSKKVDTKTNKIIYYNRLFDNKYAFVKAWENTYRDNLYMALDYDKDILEDISKEDINDNVKEKLVDKLKSVTYNIEHFQHMINESQKYFREKRSKLIKILAEYEAVSKLSENEDKIKTIMQYNIDLLTSFIIPDYTIKSVRINTNEIFKKDNDKLINEFLKYIKQTNKDVKLIMKQKDYKLKKKIVKLLKKNFETEKLNDKELIERIKFFANPKEEIEYSISTYMHNYQFSFIKKNIEELNLIYYNKNPKKHIDIFRTYGIVYFPNKKLNIPALFDRRKIENDNMLESSKIRGQDPILTEENKINKKLYLTKFFNKELYEKFFMNDDNLRFLIIPIYCVLSNDKISTILIVIDKGIPKARRLIKTGRILIFNPFGSKKKVEYIDNDIEYDIELITKDFKDGLKKYFDVNIILDYSHTYGPKDEFLPSPKYPDSFCGYYCLRVINELHETTMDEYSMILPNMDGSMIMEKKGALKNILSITNQFYKLKKTIFEKKAGEEWKKYMGINIKPDSKKFYIHESYGIYLYNSNEDGWKNLPKSFTNMFQNTLKNESFNMYVTTDMNFSGYENEIVPIYIYLNKNITTTAVLHFRKEQYVIIYVDLINIDTEDGLLEGKLNTVFTQYFSGLTFDGVMTHQNINFGKNYHSETFDDNYTVDIIQELLELVGVKVPIHNKE